MKKLTILILLILVSAISAEPNNDLIAAAIANDIASATKALEAGANVHHRGGPRRETASILAANAGHLEMLKLLLRTGAKIEQKDIDGQTAIIAAAENGKTAIVKFLIQEKANVNAQGIYGQAALIYAALGGYAEIVQLLLNAKADANIEDHDKQTALMAAKKGKHAKVVKLLKAAGAKE